MPRNVETRAFDIFPIPKKKTKQNKTKNKNKHEKEAKMSHHDYPWNLLYYSSKCLHVSHLYSLNILVQTHPTLKSKKKSNRKEWKEEGEGGKRKGKGNR